MYDVDAGVGEWYPFGGAHQDRDILKSRAEYARHCSQPGSCVRLNSDHVSRRLGKARQVKARAGTQIEKCEAVPRRNRLHRGFDPAFSIDGVILDRVDVGIGLYIRREMYAG